MPILSMSLALLCKSQLVVSLSFPFFQEKICFKLNLKYIYFVLKQTHLMKVFFQNCTVPPKKFLEDIHAGQEEVYVKFGGDSTRSVAANPDIHTWTRGKKGGDAPT